jgi:hypothetical protein
MLDHVLRRSGISIDVDKRAAIDRERNTGMSFGLQY